MRRVAGLALALAVTALLMAGPASAQIRPHRAEYTLRLGTALNATRIGTIVQATDLGTNKPETFTVLGAWDFDAEKGIISYLTPIGQALLNRKVGDEVEAEVDGVRHRHRIEKIEPYKTA